MSLTQIRICVVVYSIFLYLLVSITEGVSSQSKDSKENEPRDLELCGYCLKEFPVVDLVQHASSCSSRSEHVRILIEMYLFCFLICDVMVIVCICVMDRISESSTKHMYSIYLRKMWSWSSVVIAGCCFL